MTISSDSFSSAVSAESVFVSSDTASSGVAAVSSDLFSSSSASVGSPSELSSVTTPSVFSDMFPAGASASSAPTVSETASVSPAGVVCVSPAVSVSETVSLLFSRATTEFVRLSLTVITSPSPVSSPSVCGPLSVISSTISLPGSSTPPEFLRRMQEQSLKQRK